jgi:hypothetical protein
VNQEYKNPLSELSHPVVLGSKEFVAEIKSRFLKDKPPDRDLPALNMDKKLRKIAKTIETKIPL